jgi:prolyl oligopeptidase
MDTLDSEPVMVLDPNTWSEDGTVALGGLEFSDDGRYMAYGIQDGGTDWRLWKIMDTTTGELLDEELKWLKFGGISFTLDNAGFYYSRFPEPEEGETFQSLNLNNRVYYHRVGTPQSEDELVYEDPENPEFGFIPTVSEDGDYLVLTVWKGTDERYQIYYKSLTEENAEFVKLIDHFENEYSWIGNYGSVFLFKTNLDAPNGRVISIDVTQPDPANWKEIVPESEYALSGVSLVNDTLICDYLKDAITYIRMFDRDGNHVRDVEFPGIGTASGFGGEKDHTETFYSFSSFATPPVIYHYDMKTGESRELRRAEVGINPDDYEVKQVFYESKDGTRVPMFIAHKKGLELNGKNPTLLYGYGGFNISLTPGFSVTRVQWMEMGGVFAMPNLRGGGEYGEKWHKAGTKTQKQNVFNDFIAAAEWLIANNYTSPEHLGIQGGSNGGLLVGACMTQRPDLYGACLPAVGVMDMLKFQTWTAGRYWVDDYGDSRASKEEFEALRAYSPYHNIVDGTEYPPTLVTTADTDDRVVPGHSFKFAARLQQAHEGENPVLIRIETRAGHGSGKPTAMIIEENADQWAFLVKHLGLEPNIPNGGSGAEESND